MARKNLLRFTFALILFNVLLASLAIFNFYSSKLDMSKVVANNSSQVLGANSNLPEFNPNYIVSDQTFSSTRVFDGENKVQDYLDKVNSPLKNYTEQGKRASYWIFASARGQTSSKWGVVPNINPGLILAYLEKEQSLLSLSSYDVGKDPESRIKTAMGYGCPDTAKCASEYHGFANQLNWAAYQLQFNYNLASSGNQIVAPYHINKTITTLDEYNVFLTNAATAANYRYTHHVYWGNYNLWAIMVANGWGVDTNTYSRADLDVKNLVAKDIKLNISAANKISYEEVKSILTTNYSLGQSSDQIRLLQTYLRQEGYYMNREITGMFGVVTSQAVQNYLNDKKLGVPAAASQSKCTELINTKFNIGDTSEDIRTLQECLRKVGLFNWPSNTGYFGEVTKAAQALAAGKTEIVSAPNSSNNSCDSLKTQTYTFGETSDRVKSLQACMRKLGLFTFASDTGYFGTVTQTSLKNWQAQGQVAAIPSVTASTSCNDFKQKNYSIGNSSSEIVKLQECLRAAGLFDWPSNTGYFGPVTAEAFAKFKGSSIAQFTCADLKTQVWSFGEKSSRVKQLQDCMTQAGKFNHSGGSTGYFGEVTKAAIINWRGYF